MPRSITSIPRGAVVATDRFYDPGLDKNSWLAREMKARGVWRGPHLAYGGGRELLTAVARFEDHAGPVIAKACASFHKAEASPLVQLAVAGGSVVSPQAGAAVALIRSYGDRFCAEGPPAGDAASDVQRAAWLAGVNAAR